MQFDKKRNIFQIISSMKNKPFVLHTYFVVIGYLVPVYIL